MSSRNAWDFRSRVKSRRNNLYSMLNKIYFAVIYFHIPSVRLTKVLYSWLRNLIILTSSVIRYLAKVFYYEPTFRALCVEVGDNLVIEKLPYISGAGSIFVGTNVRLSGKIGISIGGPQFGPGLLRIGDHTFLGHNCAIIANKEVIIGNHCLIAGGVRIHDNDGHPTEPELRRLGEPAPARSVKPVRIGDNVWVGSGSIILKGVTIGMNSIIGAGSVVTENIPPNCIATGNPAKVIKILNP